MFNGNLIFSDAQEYNLCPLKYRSSLLWLAPSFNLLRRFKGEDMLNVGQGYI